MSYQDGWIVFDSDINKLLESTKGNGVIQGWSVSEQVPAAMGVTVSAGKGFINGTYRETSTSTDVTLSAADPTYPRKDIVIVNSAGTITAITGTAEAASPSGETGPSTSLPKPSDIPSGAIILAEVWVGAGVTAINDMNITDRRVIVKSPHGIYRMRTVFWSGSISAGGTVNVLNVTGKGKLIGAWMHVYAGGVRATRYEITIDGTDIVNYLPEDIGAATNPLIHMDHIDGTDVYEIADRLGLAPHPTQSPTGLYGGQLNDTTNNIYDYWVFNFPVEERARQPFCPWMDHYYNSSLSIDIGNPSGSAESVDVQIIYAEEVIPPQRPKYFHEYWVARVVSITAGGSQTFGEEITGAGVLDTMRIMAKNSADVKTLSSFEIYKDGEATAVYTATMDRPFIGFIGEYQNVFLGEYWSFYDQDVSPYRREFKLPVQIPFSDGITMKFINGDAANAAEVYIVFHIRRWI